MKYPTLHKVMLTTMALVASLALSAQAGTRAKVTSARQTFNHQQHQDGPNRPAMTARQLWHGPNATYQIDDGSAEDAIGFGNGLHNLASLWLHQFAAIHGSHTIT